MLINSEETTKKSEHVFDSTAWSTINNLSCWTWAYACWIRMRVYDFYNQQHNLCWIVLCKCKKKKMISLCGLKWKATRKNIALRNETLCTDALDRAGLDFQVIQKTMHSFVVGILYWWLFKIQTDAINYL